MSTWNRLFLVLLCSLPGSLSFAQQEPTAEPDANTPPPTAVTTTDPDIAIESLKVMVKPLTKAELQVEAEAWFDLLRAKARQISVVRLGVRKANEALAADSQSEAMESLEKATEAKEQVEEETETSDSGSDVAAGEDTAAAPTAVQEPTPVSDSTEESANDEEAAISDSQDETTDETATNDDAADLTEEEKQAQETSQKANEMKGELLQDITVLQDERTALNDRLEVVLDSLERKGGDVEEYRLYSLAISGVELDTSDAQAAWSTIVGWFTSKEGGQRWGWNLLKFVLTMVVSYVVARLLAAVVNWLLDRNINLSQLAENLISGTIRNVLMLVGFAVALTTLEIDVAPILAAIGATGLVVGLALQGTLSNFASGLMILVNRPFDVGDVVTAAGVTGKVHKMNLVSTKFHTFDNQAIYVPNNEIWNNVIINITANHTRRVDLEFGISYDDNFERAEQIIRQIVEQHKLVLKMPEPEVVTHYLADSSVNIVCRPWARTEDWWQVKTDVTREVKRRFDEAGISIPFPQREVHFTSSQRLAEDSMER